MTKTISLEEVKKLATPGKLVVLGNCLVTDSDEFLMAHDPIIGHADYGPIDAALLAHKWNHFDDLIEALEIAIELANMSDDEYERQPGKDPTKVLDAVLMRAKIVEMP